MDYWVTPIAFIKVPSNAPIWLPNLTSNREAPPYGIPNVNTTSGNHELAIDLFIPLLTDHRELVLH